MQRSLLAQRSRARRGLTLMETAVVFGVVGMVLGGVWMAASSVYAKQRVNTTVVQIWQIANNVHARYTGRTLTASPTTAQMVSAGLFPAEMIRLQGNVASIINAWGGAVNAVVCPGGMSGVQGCPSPAVPVTMLQLDFLGLRPSECMSLFADLPAASQDGGPNAVALSASSSGSGWTVETLNTLVSVSHDFPDGCLAARFQFRL